MAYLAKLLPAADNIEKWTNLKEAAEWAKLPEEFLNKLLEEMGETEHPDLETMAAIEVDDVRHSFRNLEVPVLKKTASTSC